MNPNDKLSEAAVAAFAAERLTGVPAELSIAQWALESGWGSHAPQNNCFGIKRYPGCYGEQLLQTSEYFTEAQVKQFLAMGGGRTAELDMSAPAAADGRRKYQVRDLFATFPTPTAAFTRHAMMLTRGSYAAAFKAFTEGGGLEDYIKRIGPIYATAPGYAEKLIALIRKPETVLALNTARGTPSNVEV